METTSNRAIYETHYSSKNLSLSSSRKYDQWFYDFRFSEIKKWGAQKDVADICCGSGDYLLPSLEFVGSLKAVDFSQTLLDSLQSRLENHPHRSKVEILNTNIEEPFLAENSIDFAYSICALYHVAHLQKALTQIHRILKPQGIAYLEVGMKQSLNHLFSLGWHEQASWAKPFSVSEKEMERWLSDLNLQVIDHRRFQWLPMYRPPRKYWWMMPFGLPQWKSVLGVSLGGKTLDEKVGNLWPLKHFCFRHVYWVKKR